MPDSTRKLLKTLKKSLKKRGADGIAGLARKVRALRAMRYVCVERACAVSVCVDQWQLEAYVPCVCLYRHAPNLTTYALPFVPFPPTSPVPPHLSPSPPSHPSQPKPSPHHPPRATTGPRNEHSDKRKK